ncbi:putative ribosomal protein S8e [Gregarina niphandrodes]|uniref:Ribosome biogenesis protein NSA2 homolog n=1 Tax=Gregarina niphandrodes TaxID=110365 RepID=A0A023BB96_GRENI|nr:putative ribosomal protein S8e [Gregarina niphandrodes]EZG79302.1 putative ribosomal protein S8e [Gregarina niphandrodes]|eukprot:XP_011129071.1 putative ribosomal protein S8e [Gregarina niphandrodes]
MPQNEYVELHQKRFGKAFDHDERQRKKLARAPHELSKKCRKTRKLKAKILNRKRFVEKIEIKKKIRAHEVKDVEEAAPKPEGALPTYLYDRENVNRTKVLTNMLKQKKKEKAGKWEVPIPKVKAMSEAEMFRIQASGKRKRKMWKRVLNKVCYVGDDFTRKPPKYERYIRPTALRMKKANVTHPELKATFQLDIVSVKKNPQSPLYTSLGAITKGTIIEVDVSDLGLVTQTGKVVWAKYAQVTNNPELDGCINALLLT